MRHVYSPPEGLKFDPLLPQLRQLLPEVRTLEVLFVRPSAGDIPFKGDLVSEVCIRFRNRKRLILSGAFLWKFRDTIPPEFGSDEVGWHDDNPYGPGTVEYLMRRIRLAHDSWFENVGVLQWAGAPLSATIDLVHNALDVRYPAKLDAMLRQELGCSLATVAPGALAKLKKAFRQLVDTALAGPRTKMEMVDLGNGYLGNRQMELPWRPDVRETLTLKDFWAELHPQPNVPWLVHYSADCQLLVEQALLGALSETLHLLRANNPDRAAAVLNGWAIPLSTSGQIRKPALAKAIRLSADYEPLLNEFWSLAFPLGVRDQLVVDYLADTSFNGAHS